MTLRNASLSAGLVGAFSLGTALAVTAPAPEAEAAPPAACRVPADASSLVPDGAEFMASANLKKLAKSPIYKDAKSKMRNDPEVRRTLDGLDACKLGLDDLERVTIGGSRNDEFVMIVEGDGIGSSAMLTCVAKQLAPKTPASMFAPAVSGCISGLDMGDGAGFVLDRRHLVFVSKGWKGKVQKRLGGSGRAASNGSLKSAVRNARRAAPLWFAVDVKQPIDTGMGKYDIDGVGGGVDLSRGLHLDLAAHFRSSSEAGQLRQELEGYRAMALMMGPSMGIPADVIQNVKVEGKGADLGLSVDLTESQIKQLEQAAKAQGI